MSKWHRTDKGIAISGRDRGQGDIACLHDADRALIVAGFDDRRATAEEVEKRSEPALSATGSAVHLRFPVEPHKHGLTRRRAPGRRDRLIAPSGRHWSVR